MRHQGHGPHRGTGSQLNIALNYGGKASSPARRAAMAQKAIGGGDRGFDIDENAFGMRTYTAVQPRVDPAHPHQRRDAARQLPSLAEGLRRDALHPVYGPITTQGVLQVLKDVCLAGPQVRRRPQNLKRALLC